MDFRSAAAAGLCLPPLGIGSGLPVGPPIPPLLSTCLPPPSSHASFSHTAASLTSGMYMYTAPSTIATGSQIVTSIPQGKIVLQDKHVVFRINDYLRLINRKYMNCNIT